MGKKVRKKSTIQDFSRRKEEKEKMSESPFSSIVLKEKKEEEKKETKRDNVIVQGYDPDASFADILEAFERTGNPYALPKKNREARKSSLSFGEILDKWEGKDSKTKKGDEERKKSSYKATRDFGAILSEFEGKPEEKKESVLDEEIEVVLEYDEKSEASLFKRESDDGTRSPDASWSIYGNNESFVRKQEEEKEDSKETKKSRKTKKSTYKATKDFGEILEGFYGKADETSPFVENESPDEAKDEDASLFKKENDEKTRSPEASWSIYGNNENPSKPKKKNKVKKEFSAILESYESRKKEKEIVKTFEEIIKEKGDLPEKKEYTINQLRAMMPQSSLDLHGMTESEAIEAVRIFLAECRAHNIRKISIITGKGLHSEGGIPVLREAVLNLLDREGNITERGNAPMQYGGSGALWVILKK